MTPNIFRASPVERLGVWYVEKSCDASASWIGPFDDKAAAQGYAIMLIDGKVMPQPYIPAADRAYKAAFDYHIRQGETDGDAHRIALAYVQMGGFS
jgi:hypothetical protein